jgi:AcrR family transcriptional regulator
VSSVTETISPRGRQILAAARELLEGEGVGGLSMRGLAEKLGMKAPSLYKHFPSKEALEATLISLGFEEQAELFGAALHNSPEPLAAMANAYRAYAKVNPQLYRLMYDRPLNRPLLVAGTEEAAAAPSLEATGGNQDLARAAWAFAHGITIFELNGRFGEGADVDAAWRSGIELLQAAARTRKRSTRPRAGARQPSREPSTRHSS